MKIGIVLPANIPGVQGKELMDWAKRADAGPFSSLGIIDRLVYPSFEPMVVLSAAASVTTRIRLMPSVLLATLRGAGLLAKQAASLDAISGGRLTLGLGIGRREEDFKAAPAQFKNRGRRFERQLDTMKRIWAGEGPEEGVGPIGPPPVQSGGPELLIGGRTPEAIRRVGKWADGYFAAGGYPEDVVSLYKLAEDAWKAEGRPGKPRLVSMTSYALGPNAEEKVSGYIHAYYGPLDVPHSGGRLAIRGAVTSPESVKDTIRDFSNIGMDEMLFLPTVTDIDQLERLADLVG